MDSKKNKESTSKILQERYARFLGIDWTPPVSVQQPKKRKRLAWVVWSLVLLMLVIGIRHFINTRIAITKDVKLTKSGLQQKQEIPSISELSPLPDYVAAIADTIISEQNVEIQDKSTDSKTKAEEVKATQFLVIVNSTKSKDDAIEYAKKLGASGYNSEVILTSANYYGVVLGRFSFDDAKRAINAALVSGVVTNEPYLITPDRVVDYVYPNSQ
jgi:hypothetical protein